MFVSLERDETIDCGNQQVRLCRLYFDADDKTLGGALTRMPIPLGRIGMHVFSQNSLKAEAGLREQRR